MDSTELASIQRRVLWAYEMGRLRRALLGVAPVVVIAALAACFTHRPSLTLQLGLATGTLGTWMLWYGREAQKSVLPGVTAGLIPLALALCANAIHLCGPDGCTSLCVPACAAGGGVAGLTVALVGNRWRAGPWFWASASTLSLLTGAMGCSCAGYSGIGGLVLGFGGGLVPGLLLRPRG